MDPVISIIIPVYNVEKFLCRCLDSVINQTYRNLEIILIDDGSTDESGKICDEYVLKDSRIRVLHQDNKGVSAARNLGIRMSNGQYMAFIDGDDWIEKDMFSFLLGLLEGNKADMAGCGYYLNNDADPDLDPESKPQILKREEAIRMSLELKDFCFDCSVFNKIFSSEIFKANGICFDEAVAIGEDMLFLCRCIMDSEKIVYSQIPKYHVVANENSATRKPFNSKKVSLVEAHEKMEDIVRERYPKLVPVIRQRSAVSSYRLLSEAKANSSLDVAAAIRTLQNDVRRNLKYALKCRELSMKDKAGLTLAMMNMTAYRRAYQLHESVMRLLNGKA